MVIKPRLPGSLINALTSLLTLEETDYNFIHSTIDITVAQPMQGMKGLLGIKGVKLA